MANNIVCENSKPGTSSAVWDIQYGDGGGDGDPTIQGYATTISVNQGQTVSFKIDTDAKAYTISIYRLGWYGGMGARFIASVTPSVTLPQTQPACVTDSTTSLVDCGTWAVSASWAVPSNATSGVYIAHLIRTDTGGDSHIVFIVRNDSSTSDILYQTADESWQAYNPYGTGGFTLYGNDNGFNLPARAYKVSYNRPFNTRGFEAEAATWVFGAEFPMIQWLESNGYNVTYTTGLDISNNTGSLITNHKIFMDAGHDEYWSGPQRPYVQAAINAGVNTAFFSGNEMFWKTRWEPSIDGTNTPNRTLVCYKETLAFAQIDPDDPPTWTGTWRDPTFSPPADGGKPENAVTGTLFMVNGPGTDNPGSLQITVPSTYSQLRFWRNTAIAKLAPNTSYTMPTGTLGYEWDVDADNGSRPAGAFELSSSTYALTTDYLLDWGATYGAGTATHHLMTYRAASGALVFGAGTVQWSWGLSSFHDNPFGFDNPNPDVNIEQATVNLFADMGVQPATLQSGLVAATKSTDTTPPTSVITSPTAGSTVSVGTVTTVTGTATDVGGGVVAGVEVSVNGGTTWHPATGRGSWSYVWTPGNVGNLTIQSRAVDDSGNLEVPSAGVTITVGAHDCPCDAWNSSATPGTVDSGDPSSVELGVKFRSDYTGYITGIRFYKASTNTGTHVGSLWTTSGTLLGSATFTNETSSGWQQVNFAAPVPIAANTVYIASYFAPNGHYSADEFFFEMQGVDDTPIHLLQSGVDGPNGVYIYTPYSAFPTSSYNDANYWVDVVFLPSGSMPGAPPALAVSPASLSFAGSVGLPNPPAQSVFIQNQGTSALNWTASASASWIVLSATSGTTPQNLNISVNTSGLTAGNYSGTVTISSSGANNSPQTVNVSLIVSYVLMNGNFSTGDTEGWVPSPLGLLSNWSVTNQILSYNGGGMTQLYAGNTSWSNYNVSASFQLSTLLNFPGGIRGRVNPSTGAGYFVWLYPANGLIKLWKNTTWDVDSGVITLLGQGSATFDTTNVHSIEMSFSGTQIEVLYDGVVVVTATDSTSSSGMVALDVDNQPISFKNVLVTSSTPNPASYSLSPSSLSYSASYLGSNPAAQNVQLTSASTLAWTAVSSAPWITVSPVTGVSPATLQVSVNSSSLGWGTYTGTVQLVSFGASSPVQTISVNLTVAPPPPTIVSSLSSLSFTANTGQAAPPSQSLAVTNGGAGSFGYSVSVDSSWIVVSPTSGSTPGAVTVSVNPAGLTTGTYSGNVIITATGVGNSPLDVPVSMLLLTQDMDETFTDMGSGWVFSPLGNASGWSVSNGVFSYAGIGKSQACAGNSAWTNYVLNANVQVTTSSDFPGGIRARVNPSTGASYFVWLYPGDGLIKLWRVAAWNVDDSSLTLLGSAPLSFDTNTHDLTLSVYGTQITVSWDGQQKINTTDSTYSSGYVCLDGDNQPINFSNIRVNGVQSDVSLATPSPSSLVFAAVPGSTPGPQTVSISATGSAATTWGVSTNQPWLTATASTSLTPGTITVSVNPAALAEGTYSGVVTVSAPGAANSPVAIPVTLAVKTAALGVTPTTLTFFGASNFNPAPETFQVANLGTGTLGWTATVTSSWIGLSATSGNAPSTVTVSPNTSGLANGTYNDTISVNSSDVSNGPGTISVTDQVGTLLFSDNFSEGSGNWTVGPLGYASGWSVASGTYTYNGEGATQSYAGSSAWTDYTVATNFQLSSTNDNPGGLRGRLNTSTGAAYGAWIYPAEQTIRLYRINQWDIDLGYATLGSALVSTSGLVIDTKVHNLRLCFQGSTIEVYYDNVLIITATDTTYTGGAIALDVSDQPIAFSNVSVISLP